MGPSTKDRILDAAETLFAERGFEGTSLRGVTSEAGVNLAAVNYHFGSKLGLFQAVFERRVGHVNRERLELLDALEARPDTPPTPEELLEAFLGPALRRVREEGGYESFLRIVGRSHSSSGEHVEAIQHVFREVQMRYLPAFARALPALSEPEIVWRVHFLVGAMCSLLADPSRIKLLSGGRCDSEDPEETLRQLVAFAAAGFRGAPAKTGEEVAR